VNCRKGKRLSLIDLWNMDGEKVILILNNDNEEEIYTVKLTYNKEYGIGILIDEIGLYTFTTIFNEDYNIKVYEYIEEKIEKIIPLPSLIEYRFWQIMQMIHEGNLKDEDIITEIHYGDNYKIENLLNDCTIKNFINSLFTIKEKEYLTFNEAKKLGTPSHKEFGDYLHEDFYCIKDLITEMDKKVWEVK